MTKAVQAAVWGVTPTFASLLFTDLGVSDDSVSTGQAFPYDVPYLPVAALKQIQALATEHGYEAWPPDRLAAYQGKDVCAKRAAVSGFLWQRYCDDATMTLDTLKMWHEVEQIERVLQVPSWFKHQHYHEDWQTLWQNKLGTRKQDLERQHQAVLTQILAVRPGK